MRTNIKYHFQSVLLIIWVLAFSTGMSAQSLQVNWTFKTDGGWIIGDPALYGDTLYIGGSDNFSMLAFNATSGQLLWKNKRAKNIYGKPVVTHDWVIYSGGNAYNPRDPGEVVVVARQSGETVAVMETASGSFSTPVLSRDNSILFGTNDGTIYSVGMRY